MVLQWAPMESIQDYHTPPPNRPVSALPLQNLAAHLERVALKQRVEVAEAAAKESSALLGEETRRRELAEAGAAGLQQSHALMRDAYTALQREHEELARRFDAGQAELADRRLREEASAAEAAAAAANPLTDDVGSDVAELRSKLRSAETARGMALGRLERERIAHAPRHTPRERGVEQARSNRSAECYERSLAALLAQADTASNVLADCRERCEALEQELSGHRGRAAGRGKQVAGSFVLLQPLRTPAGYPLARTLAFLRKVVDETKMSFEAARVANVLFYQMHFGNQRGDFISEDRMISSDMVVNGVVKLGEQDNADVAARRRASPQFWGVMADGGRGFNLAALSLWDRSLDKAVTSPLACADLMHNGSAANSAATLNAAIKGAGLAPKMCCNGLSDGAPRVRRTR